MDTIGATHKEERTTAQAVPAVVVAGVPAGDLRLRYDLSTCCTSLLSQAVAGAVERDAHVLLRAGRAEDIVQVGRDADDLFRACQAVIKADRYR